MHDTSIISAARLAFGIAALAVSGMLLLMLLRADGAAAISGIAGLPHDVKVTEVSLRLAVFCDMLLPIGYTCGFILLALSRMAQRYILTGTVILFTAAGGMFDFLENGAAVFADPIPGLTVAKFGALAIASFFLGVLVQSPAPLDRAAAPLLMLGVPIFLALLVSGLLGPATVWIFAPALLGTLLFGAVIAREDTAASERAPA